MSAQADRVLGQAQVAARHLALERLPAFLRTSSLEVLVGTAVIVLGILEGGLIGAALVGLGTLLVAWTTATGVAAEATRTTMRAAQAARDAALTARLLELQEQLTTAEAAEDPAVRAALVAQAHRALALTLAEVAHETDRSSTTVS